MWRTQPFQRQGQRILNIARRQSSEAAPPKPTPPPANSSTRKTGGFGLFKFLGLSTPLVSASLLGYAWYDPQFRKQLELNVPYAKEVFDAVLPAPAQSPSPPPFAAPIPGLEKATMLHDQSEASLHVPGEQDKFTLLPDSLPKSTSNPFDAFEVMIKNPFMSADNEKRITEEIIAHKANPLYGLTGPDIATQQSYIPPLREIDLEQLLKSPNLEDTSKNETQDLQMEKETERATERAMGKEAVEDQLRKLEDEEKADNAALEVVIHKFVTNSENLSEEAVKAQADYASAVRNHTKLLRQAMDDTSDILEKDAQWEAVAIAYSEREYAKERANELISESKRTMERLREVLNNGKSNKVTKQNPAIVPAAKMVNELMKELNASSAKVRQAEAESNVMMKYKDLVDKGKKQFQKEIESLLPDVKIGSGKKLSEDELNSLIAHAHRRIEQLQKQIAEHLAMERQRLNAALETQRQEDLQLTDSAVLDERARMHREFDIEAQKLEMEYLVQVEAEVRKQLARQAAAHSDHIKDVLAVQQNQLNVEFNREMNAKLLEEREKFQTEVSGWIARLKGIEAAVDARADSEKLARSAQDLWLACIAMNSVLQFGSESELDDRTRPVPLQNKVDAILNSGLKHPFVEAVAASIPEEAKQEGVYTEAELRSRFTRVACICRRLGLVQAPNTSLYKYFVSYLHSFMVFDHIKAQSSSDEVDLSKIDNFDLIAYAQYWMEKGNIELALKYMNQLTGESGRAASGWIRDVRLYLETKQCANTLLAFASATGLANTF